MKRCSQIISLHDCDIHKGCSFNYCIDGGLHMMSTRFSLISRKNVFIYQQLLYAYT